MEYYCQCSKCGNYEYCRYISANNVYNCNDCYFERPKPPKIGDLENDIEKLTKENGQLLRSLKTARDDVVKLREEIAQLKSSQTSTEQFQ